MKDENIIYLVLISWIIIVCIVDWASPQLPAASPQEAVWEAIKIVSAAGIGAQKMIEER